jgi:geranylgeranyl reductase family protein
MAKEFDAVIVGGGIAGSTAGKLIAERGYNVLILEEHHEAGKPLQCAGLVTPRIFDHIPANGCILNEVHGARIYSPTGKVLEIDAKKPKALVIDRVKFDQESMTLALRSGAELHLGAKALAAKSANGRVRLKFLRTGEVHTINCKLLIGADGVQSRVARWFGLKGPNNILSGFGAEVTGAELDPRFVEIYLGNHVAPNFFAWAIPKSRITEAGRVPARLGLACTQNATNAYRYYHQLFVHPILGPKLTNSKPIQYIAGGIPIGLLNKTYKDHVMLLGDAAGQVKPTSGGGVYTGIICANYCAEVAVTALENNDFSSTTLKLYQKKWLDNIGKELKRGMRLHKVFMRLRDDQLEEGFRLLEDEKIMELISKHGDIDYPSKLVMKLFKKVPQLLMFAKPYLRSFFD